jgi:hypothetical protein
VIAQDHKPTDMLSEKGPKSTSNSGSEN